MIRGYSDHAANERTFLAWVRTGIAIVVFGFVIEKFNLFLLMIADADAVKGRRAALERLSGPVGRYEGLALILVGLPLIVAAAIRFIWVRRLLADQETHDVGGYGPDLVLSGVLALAIAAYSIYLLLLS
jgi:putative membrane protein